MHHPYTYRVIELSIVIRIVCFDEAFFFWNRIFDQWLFTISYSINCLKLQAYSKTFVI
jgi:hypothetical protein